MEGDSQKDCRQFREPGKASNGNFASPIAHESSSSRITISLFFGTTLHIFVCCLQQYFDSIMVLYSVAFALAAKSALALIISHALCCGIIMHYDLSGKWASFQLHPKRSVSVQDYLDGAKSFAADMVLLFLPFMTLCYSYRADAILESQDSVFVALIKLALGYMLGKLWAFGVHYILHFPSFYAFHRAHHCNPKTLVASRAWQDSYIEYAIMELPSFAMTALLFPTQVWAHLLHFVWHGWDGAAGHSGFAAPGWLGAAFDGTYHYHHHAHLTVNYAEIEILDKICGTHHTQKGRPSAH